MKEIIGITAVLGLAAAIRERAKVARENLRGTGIRLAKMCLISDMTCKLNYNGGRVRFLSWWATILLAATALPTFASQKVELEWNPSISTNVVGYNVYYGGASDNYTNEVSSEAVTNLTLSGLADGTTYYFAVRAVNSSGIESGCSLQTTYAVPTAAAILAQPLFTSNGMSITVKGVPGYLYVVQASTDMVNWVALQTNVTPLLFKDTNSWRYPKRFYRAVYF